MPDPNRQVWSDPNSFATTLLVVFLDRFGTEALTWEPSTIAIEIEDEFRVNLSQHALDRLLVGIQLLTTDSFTKSLPDFIQFCNILSGDTYDPRNWDPADAVEIAWGLTESLLLDPPDEDEPFTDEIRAYIGAVLDQEGIMQAPDILQIALRDTVKPTFQGDYSDDPTMFAAIYQFEAGKTQDINTVVRTNLEQLAVQLESLRLRTGSPKAIIQHLRSAAAA